MVENLTMARVDLSKVFRKAAKAAHAKWVTTLEPDDVENALWVWYLENPYVCRKFESFDNQTEAIKYATNQANNILGADVSDSYVFSGQAVYSIESVKDSLKVRSTNTDLNRIMPVAMERLRSRNHRYATALESRYVLMVIPQSNAESQTLKDAHRALTEIVNQVQRDEARDHDKKHDIRIDPSTRKGSGGLSDPTASIALALIDNPAEREAFYESDPLPVTHGVISEPSPNPVWNIFDHDLQGMARLDNYRASVCPELYPNERADYVPGET
jgi:hypothetical protein